MSKFATFLSLFVPEKDHEYVVICMPKPMYAALETVSYLNKVEKEEVILIALEDYLIKNVYATKEDGNRTKFKRMKQLR